MNIVNSGNHFQIYGEAIKTYKTLPVNCYLVDFDPMSGFSLVPHNELVIQEEKIYGSIQNKIDKVMNSYFRAARNFGVLLSGQKGIGKSLFVKLAAKAGLEKNLPVIIVNTAANGVADFLSSITQDCIVTFDEFEKTFNLSNDKNPQDELLTLFDGLDGGHKLFLVTCNEINKISSYMINRPGRFHYHFNLQAPSEQEIKEYLTDKISPQYQNAIPDILKLSGIIEMPYDYLRAIAFDINQGYSLSEVLEDLNITQVKWVTFDVKVYLTNGLCYEGWNETLDLNSREPIELYGRRYTSIPSDKYPASIYVTIDPTMVKIIGKEYVINEHIILEQDSDSEVKLTPERVVLKKVEEKSVIKYTV